MPNTQETQGQRFNWYHRYWHDWAEVQEIVYEVAKAYVRVKVFVARRAESRRPSPHVDLWVDMERRSGNKFHAKSATIEPQP